MKKIKSLIVLTLAFGAITFSSCKKDKQNPTPTATGTFTADIDGTATTFNVHALATTGSVGERPITIVTGTSAAGNSISITLYDSVTAGKTYSLSTTPDSEPTILYSTASDDAFMNDEDSSNPVSVTISSKSSSSISGTFKGGVVEDSGSAKKSITNGKFSVSFIAGS